MKLGGPAQHQIDACKRKPRHVSREIADRAVRIVWIQRRAVVRSYRCPVCQGWHLTERLGE